MWMVVLEVNHMNKGKTMTVLSLLALIAITVGGITYVLGDIVVEQIEFPCDGQGPYSLFMGRGFWSQLTEEQRNELFEETQNMLEAGATHEEIRAMKTAKLEEWGIDAPLWSGPHYGEQSGSYGRETRGGKGNGGQGYGGQGYGLRGQGYNGQCPRTG